MSVSSQGSNTLPHGSGTYPEPRPAPRPLPPGPRPPRPAFCWPFWLGARLLSAVGAGAMPVTPNRSTLLRTYRVLKHTQSFFVNGL
jgi:hypothetical protein